MKLSLTSAFLFSIVEGAYRSEIKVSKRRCGWTTDWARPPATFVVRRRLRWSLTPFIISCSLTRTQIRDDAVHNDYTNPLPHTYLNAARLPDDFHWGNVNGVSCTCVSSYLPDLTHSLNQHVPQYCGSWYVVFFFGEGCLDTRNKTVVLTLFLFATVGHTDL
eukprot:scaffold13351_cov200-Amphora_coffeaeformis.AAC.9